MKRLVLIASLTAIVLASVLNGILIAQPILPSPTNDNSNISLENRKVKIEEDKLELEKSKIRWTAVSTIAPFIGVLITVYISVWSLRRQSRQQEEQRREDAARLELQRKEDAKLQFEMKAAEIAFTGETPLAVRDRAKALKAMFSTRLPANFLDAYDPYEFGEKEGNNESKKFFLELLLKYPEQQFETLCFWKELFPGDVDWLYRIHLSPHEITKTEEASGPPQQDNTVVKTSPEIDSTASPRAVESSPPPLPESSLTSSSPQPDSTISNENTGSED